MDPKEEIRRFVLLHVRAVNFEIRHPFRTKIMSETVPGKTFDEVLGEMTKVDWQKRVGSAWNMFGGRG